MVMSASEEDVLGALMVACRDIVLRKYTNTPRCTQDKWRRLGRQAKVAMGTHGHCAS